MHQWIEDFRDGWRIESWKDRATSLFGIAVAVGSLVLVVFHAFQYGIEDVSTLGYFVTFFLTSIVAALALVDTALTGAHVRKQFTRHT